MLKRFIIAASIVGLFLGGLAYFNLVFKPKMIGEFMAKMVPPPATVTSRLRIGAAGCAINIVRWKGWRSPTRWRAS
jgi:hypothetical protein